MDKVKEIALYFLWLVFGGLTLIGVTKFLSLTFRLMGESIAGFLEWANNKPEQHHKYVLDEFTGERIFNQDNWYCPGCKVDNATFCNVPTQPPKPTDGQSKEI